MIDLETIAFQNTEALVYLGCGELQQLHNLSETARIILVDADSSIIEILQAKLGSQSKIECLHRFISTDGTKKNFSYFNLSLFNGFVEGESLKALYPGIKLRESGTVNTTDVSKLIEELNIGSNSSNILLLDIPSLNAQLLQRLKDSGHLYQFHTIKTYQQVGNLIEDESSASELVLWFLDNGFLALQQATADPDFSLISAQINPLFTVNKRLQYELEIQSKELYESEQRAFKSEQMIADVKIRQAELENQLSTKDAALIAVSDEREQLLKKLVAKENENSRIIDELNNVIKLQKEQLKKLAIDFQHSLTRSKEHYDSTMSQLNELVKERDNLRKFKLEVTELEKQLGIEKKSKAEESARSLKLESEKNELLKNVEEKVDRLERLKIERDMARSERDTAREERDNHKSQIDQSAKQNEAKTNLLNSKLLQLNALQKQLARLQHENQKVSLEKARHQKALTQAEAQLEVIKSLFIKPKVQQ